MGKGAVVAAGGLGAAAGIITVVGTRPLWQNWGATPTEISAVLPGDELVPEPAADTTRATGVDAPPEEVWRWLVQIGQGRGGMYSYDWLENLIGLDIHSVDEIRPELQELHEGDRIVLVRPGWMGLASGYSLPVVAVEPGRHLVTWQRPPEHPWNAVWSFHVRADGPGRSRLISRGRAEVRPGMAGRVGGVMDALMDPVTLLMTRRMLLGIAERAERSWAGRSAGVS